MTRLTGDDPRLNAEGPRGVVRLRGTRPRVAFFRLGQKHGLGRAISSHEVAAEIRLDSGTDRARNLRWDQGLQQNLWVKTGSERASA